MLPIEERITGRPVSGDSGTVTGELLITHKTLDLDILLSVKDGVVTSPVSDIQGSDIREKILLVPDARDSPAVCDALIRLSRKGMAPSAIISRRVGTTLSTFSLITSVPVVELYRPDPYTIFRKGERISLDTGTGLIIGGRNP